jgi:HAE1 family hydrophobic/amphiphilic exporter-1
LHLTHTHRAAHRLADPAITSAFKGIAGVSQVNLVGEVKREMTIQLKPQALQAAASASHR